LWDVQCSHECADMRGRIDSRKVVVYIMARNMWLRKNECGKRSARDMQVRGELKKQKNECMLILKFRDMNLEYLCN
jgi:hypothetical protein